jgi:hypothetical protein
MVSASIVSLPANGHQVFYVRMALDRGYTTLKPGHQGNQYRSIINMRAVSCLLFTKVGRSKLWRMSQPFSLRSSPPRIV